MQYTDERIPKRTRQGGRRSRSVFDAKTSSGYHGSGDEHNGRWKLITQEELFGRPEKEPARSAEPDPSGRFPSLLRMIRHYQVTDKGRTESFLEQAKLMEDYEEDGYISDIAFYHQYAGYQEMDVRELHGYFSWRSRFRRDEAVPYCFEYMRLYAAELINLIGVRDRQDAFARLLKLQVMLLPGTSRQREKGLQSGDGLLHGAGQTQGRGPVSLDALMRRSGFPGRLSVTEERDRRSLRDILAGFVITWADDAGRPPKAVAPGVSHIELAQEYCIIDPGREIENTTLLHYESSSDAAVCRMIRRLTSGRALSSAFWKEAGEDGWHVLARVFRSVCRIQKQAGSPVLAQRLLGDRGTWPKDLFPMIPYETRVPDGYEIEVSPATSYLYRDGYWYRSGYPLMRDDAAVRELNAIVRECERVLRRKMHYRNQLQNQLHNPTLEKVISGEFDRWMKEKAQRMRPEVRVDLSRLGAIRELAAVTRERLLEGTDEGLEAEELAALTRERLPEGTDGGLEELAAVTRERMPEGMDEGLEAEALAAGVMMNDPDQDPASEGGESVEESLFNDQESAFLRMLLKGGNGADFFKDHRILPSVFVDALNEKAFDEIGDSIVEEDGAGWTLVEDYIGDVEALLGNE